MLSPKPKEHAGTECELTTLKGKQNIQKANTSSNGEGGQQGNSVMQNLDVWSYRCNFAEPIADGGCLLRIPKSNGNVNRLTKYNSIGGLKGQYGATWVLLLPGADDTAFLPRSPLLP